MEVFHVFLKTPAKRSIRLPRSRAQRLQCVRERNRQPSTIHALNINKDTYTERKIGTEHI